MWRGNRLAGVPKEPTYAPNENNANYKWQFCVDVVENLAGENQPGDTKAELCTTPYPVGLCIIVSRGMGRK